LNCNNKVLVEVNMGKLTGKVAIVTGASKGIGAGIAKGMGASGAAVVVNYFSSKEGADLVVADIVGSGGKAVAIQGDISNAVDVRRLFSETQETFGSLDVLVNNAGVYKFGPLASVTEDEFRRHFNTNVLGALLVTQEAVRHFPPHGGSIINIGSIASIVATPMTVIYTATKGALDSITQVLAKELGPANIRVNSISPGVTETEGGKALGPRNPDFVRQILSQTPLGRFANPTDIAPIAVFLASDDSAWLTGETLVASGGMR
jgi:3-oxoacyl-[acyl-carrier protein] reductase